MTKKGDGAKGRAAKRNASQAGLRRAGASNRGGIWTWRGGRRGK